MRSVTVIAVMTLAVSLAASAQPGSGAKYGSRDLKTCPAATFTGPPSAEQAKQLFTCGSERDTGGTITLVENVAVQVAPAARKFQPGDSYNDIDQNGPVYPIRGSFTNYSCAKVYNLDASHTNAGTNCTVLQQPHAQGICYKTTFGEWACTMRDPSMHWDVATSRMAPPKQGFPSGRIR